MESGRGWRAAERRVGWRRRSGDCEATAADGRTFRGGMRKVRRLVASYGKQETLPVVADPKNASSLSPRPPRPNFAESQVNVSALAGKPSLLGSALAASCMRSLVGGRTKLAPYPDNLVPVARRDIGIGPAGGASLLPRRRRDRSTKRHARRCPSLRAPTLVQCEPPPSGTPPRSGESRRRYHRWVMLPALPDGIIQRAKHTMATDWRAWGWDVRRSLRITCCEEAERERNDCAS